MTNTIEIIEPTKDVAVAINANPALAILDAEKFEAFYELIKSEAEKVSKDANTIKGRDEMRSMAFKIAKTKTAIDKARLGLTEEWRKKTKQANEAGKSIETRLEALAAEVRLPLTQWEEKEAAREAEKKRILDLFESEVILSIDDNSQTIQEKLDKVSGVALSQEIFGGALDSAKTAKSKAIGILNNALARALNEEAERAELERLRNEAAAREAEEAEKMAKLEAEAKAEAERLAEEQRLERIRQEAAENARLGQERAHASALAAERERADKIERQAREDAERQAAEVAQEEAARLAREQNQAHRSKVMGAAKDALINCGIEEAKAREIVLAIAAGNIPNVAISF